FFRLFEPVKHFRICVTIQFELNKLSHHSNIANFLNENFLLFGTILHRVLGHRQSEDIPQNADEYERLSLEVSYNRLNSPRLIVNSNIRDLISKMLLTSFLGRSNE
ncbi:hypothetical protein BpHYR1_015837, partial [Brachionus plicatilis]